MNFLEILAKSKFGKVVHGKLTKKSTHLKRVCLFAGLPFFFIVTTYAVDTQIKDTQKSVPISKVIERLAAPKAPQYNKSAFYWKDIFVKSGDTVGSILNGLGKDGKEAEVFIYANPVSKNLLRLHIDQPVSVLINDEGKLTAVQFFNDDENGEKILVAIEKKDDKWQATTDELETETVETVKLVKVHTTARGNLAQNEVPADIRESLNEIFSDKFSLNDLQEGDTVRLIFESFYYRGQVVATGNILAAEIAKNGENYSAYYFARSNNKETGTYYDEAGATMKKGFEIMPVNNTRISSGYGMRRHPILGSYRLHSGIDYAAPAGTPIIAPAAGVIVERGVKGGYGNAIVIEHPNGMRTLYGHMSRFQQGQNVGQQIPTGTIIGYVGSTGRSTGPHLHYEVRVNGQPVDPSTSALPTQKLNSNELAVYFKANNELNEKLTLMKFDFSAPVAQVAKK